jgi:hypothetical protein
MALKWWETTPGHKGKITSQQVDAAYRKMNMYPSQENRNRYEELKKRYEAQHNTTVHSGGKEVTFDK